VVAVVPGARMRNGRAGVGRRPPGARRVSVAAGRAGGDLRAEHGGQVSIAVHSIIPPRANNLAGVVRIRTTRRSVRVRRRQHDSRFVVALEDDDPDVPGNIVKPG